MEKYTCPVCGYPDLLDPPYDLVDQSPSFDICPCCGYEYGYNDATPEAKNTYLRNWIKDGGEWFHPELRPDGWNLKDQLRQVGIDLNDREG